MPERMSTGQHARTISRPTPLQAAAMATSGAARIAVALAQSPLIHVRGPRPVRLARVAAVFALLLTLLAAAVAIWS